MQLNGSSYSTAFNNLFNRQISNQTKQKGEDLQISTQYFFPWSQLEAFKVEEMERELTEAARANRHGLLATHASLLWIRL